MQQNSIRILVNGISAKGGGGISILSNFLRAAAQESDQFHYVVSVPNAEKFSDLAGPRVSLVSVKAWSWRAIIPLSSILFIPYLMQRLQCDLLLNLADVPVMTRKPQVFLFDWPHAAFPESPAWRFGSILERFERKIKLKFFNKLLPFVDCLVAQSETMAKRLISVYDLKKVIVIPNAVSLENYSGGEAHDFGLGDGFKLLCLSRYYSHKNIEILLPVARRIRDAGINVKLVVTLSEEEHPRARQFLQQISSDRLSNIIINVGEVPMRHVPSLYQQTDALLLPTLLESFSGTYVEAMHHGRPILTSNLEFASGVCGDSAFYFDPMDDAEIFQTIQFVICNPDAKIRIVSKARETLLNMPNWNQAYKLFKKQFEECKY